MEMAGKIYRVKLSKNELDLLQGLVRKGNHSVQSLRAAYILLNCNESNPTGITTNRDLSRVLKVSMRTIDRVKRKYIREGIESVLGKHKETNTRKSRVSDIARKTIMELYSSDPPDGYRRWTLRMLADKIKDYENVDKVSHVTVGKILQQMDQNGSS